MDSNKGMLMLLVFVAGVAIISLSISETVRYEQLTGDAIRYYRASDIKNDYRENLIPVNPLSPRTITPPTPVQPSENVGETENIIPFTVVNLGEGFRMPSGQTFVFEHLDIGRKTIRFAQIDSNNRRLNNIDLSYWSNQFRFTYAGRLYPGTIDTSASVIEFVDELVTLGPTNIVDDNDDLVREIYSGDVFELSNKRAFQFHMANLADELLVFSQQLYNSEPIITEVTYSPTGNVNVKRFILISGGRSFSGLFNPRTLQLIFDEPVRLLEASDLRNGLLTVNGNLLEGETTEHYLNGYTYEVTNLLIYEGGTKFYVNREITDSLNPGDSFVFEDQSYVKIKSIWNDRVSYCYSRPEGVC